MEDDRSRPIFVSPIIARDFNGLILLDSLLFPRLNESFGISMDFRFFRFVNRENLSLEDLEFGNGSILDFLMRLNESLGV